MKKIIDILTDPANVVFGNCSCRGVLMEVSAQ
jgi:hypothetical protein